MRCGASSGCREVGRRSGNSGQRPQRSNEESGMAVEAHRSISQGELLALAKQRGVFEGIVFAPPLELDDIALSHRKFIRCLFQYPVVRAADLSAARLKYCVFPP